MTPDDPGADDPRTNGAPADDAGAAEPANLRFLRRLVTVLTAVMIAGLLAIFGLLVIRFSAEPPVLPASITLPDGAEAEAFTQAADWYAVVTRDGRILVFDRASGALRQEVKIAPAD